MERGARRGVGTPAAAWGVRGERRKWIPGECGERKTRVRGGERGADGAGEEGRGGKVLERRGGVGGRPGEKTL